MGRESHCTTLLLLHRRLATTLQIDFRGISIYASIISHDGTLTPDIYHGQKVYIALIFLSRSHSSTLRICFKIE